MKARTTVLDKKDPFLLEGLILFYFFTWNPFLERKTTTHEIKGELFWEKERDLWGGREGSRVCV